MFIKRRRNVKSSMLGIAVFSMTIASFGFSQTSFAALPNTLKSCSTDWSKTTNFKLYNNHNDYVDVMWMDYQCNEQKYMTLSPGASYVQSTFVTHPWRIRESRSGKLLKQFTPDNSTTRYLSVNDECSAASVDKTQMEVKNNSGKAVYVYWKGFDCKERYYLKVNPYSSNTLYSYAGHAWRIRDAASGKILKDVQLSSTSLSRVYVSDRSTYDRADDTSFYQAHIVYVLPKDRADETLDLNGSITTSLSAINNWFDKESGGQKLVFDTYNGALDISFVRLTKTDAEMQAAAQAIGSPAYMREVIESELHSRGFNRDGRIYLAYYGGTSTWACGGASFPPDGPNGNVVALYLKGTPPGAIPCANNAFAKDENSPKYWEFAALHEVFHSLGMVPNPASASIPDYCAPNNNETSHVGDNPNDIMYAGPLPWTPSILDFGRDDYFKHNKAGCPDLADSVFLSPASRNAVAPLGWK